MGLMESYPDNAERLRSLKDGFRERMLICDPFFMLAQQCVARAGLHIDRADPAFDCEPTFEQISQDRYCLGIRLGYDTTLEEGHLVRGLGPYVYIRLGEWEATMKRIQFNREFQREIASANGMVDGSTEVLQACNATIRAWQEGWNDIRTSMGQRVAVHPQDHTVELLEEIDLRTRH